MIEKLLIANRGEIACRIIRTARRLGIRTVTLYSDADEHSLQVTLADEAHYLGPSPASESYLRGNRILELAQKAGAQAIHPGYGFLSENAAFAEQCRQKGILFIGPPVSAILAMGSKSAAKAIMERAGVPLVPGYHGENQDENFLKEQAQRIGYPLLIKASAGGGGKGMRVVENAGDFEEALAGARREAKNAFGDEQVLLERYLRRPRHVEIQVFADAAGNCVHLFERDCSIQRRHQKVVEEAPAPGMSEELRRRMGEAATGAAKAIGYVGAGTVEFLLDEDGSFYFMEMNTRLQVEHPVTEMISGQDLVEWQIRVAQGEPLPLSQEQLAIEGHAFEVRIYAEDPTRDFLPSIGRILHLRTPQESPHVRIDSGVRQGDEIGIHYDPMIAKLIVWDRDRPRALRRLRGALEAYEVTGVTTNLPFLAAIARSPAFFDARLDTGFIERHRGELIPEEQSADDRTLALAALQLLLEREREAAREAAASLDPYSPWSLANGWRLNSDNHHDFVFEDGDRSVRVSAHYRKDGYLLELPGGSLAVKGTLAEDGSLMADLGGLRLRAQVIRSGAELRILCRGGSRRLLLKDPYERQEQEQSGGRLTAPMPGKIVALMVDAGSEVDKGAPLVILEAMKMEHCIRAPAAGKVLSLNFAVGALVGDGAELLEFQPAQEA